MGRNNEASPSTGSTPLEVILMDRFTPETLEKLILSYLDSRGLKHGSVYERLVALPRLAYNIKTGRL